MWIFIYFFLVSRKEYNPNEIKITRFINFIQDIFLRERCLFGETARRKATELIDSTYTLGPYIRTLFIIALIVLGVGSTNPFPSLFLHFIILKVLLRHLLLIKNSALCEKRSNHRARSTGERISCEFTRRRPMPASCEAS